MCRAPTNTRPGRARSFDVYFFAKVGSLILLSGIVEPQIVIGPNFKPKLLIFVLKVQKTTIVSVRVINDSLTFWTN